MKAAIAVETLGATILRARAYALMPARDPDKALP